jgi:3'(2'), 5'-bisphosphate nucleotidase
MIRTDVITDNYLETAVQAALSAGSVILDIYNTPFDVSYKDDHSPLTIADRKSHELINTLLSERKTSAPVLSEEGKKTPYGERKKWKLVWLVDPLDGTKEFIRHNGEFTVNIALIEKGRPVVGVVYAPVTDTLYFAQTHHGAYRINKARYRLKSGENISMIISMAETLPVEQRADNNTLVIAASRSHFSGKTEEYCSRLKGNGRKIEFVFAGSALKFCLLAEGKADLYPRLGTTMEWDTAAGHAIAEEAGATIAVYETNQPLVYNKENLTNPWFVVRGKGCSI